MPIETLFVAVQLPFLSAGCRSVTVSRWLSLYKFELDWIKSLLKILIYIDFFRKIGILWTTLDKYYIDYEPRGSGFNSCQPHHNISVIEQQLRDQKSLGCFSLCVRFKSLCPNGVRLVLACER